MLAIAGECALSSAQPGASRNDALTISDQLIVSHGSGEEINRTVSEIRCTNEWHARSRAEISRMRKTVPQLSAPIQIFR